MPSLPFFTVFKDLTGNDPFPWQSALYERFVANDLPSTANIPTGLGKTSIIAIWLISLAQYPDRVPRRLVYVVNRRTVVDQTTSEVERLRNALTKPELAEICNALESLCALPLPTPDTPPLAISTLRGQFADNGEWCTDPSRPAVVVGTVDMIGSGLLFSRYSRGFKTRPLHAGFLAQDALLVHDEAHLEPTFQTLLNGIVAEQAHCTDPRKLRVIELTATNRTAAAKPFGLDENLNNKDTDNGTVKKRYNAVKRLSLVPVTKVEDSKDKANEGTVRDKILQLALAKKESSRAVLVFVRSVEAAEKIAGDLSKAEQVVATLTGTMRGKERDELVSKNPVFQRFLPEANRTAGVRTVYLIATSAGEVGVNLSADDLVCDLSTYESMAQRFGRVNRFGERDDSEVSVVYRTNLQSNYDEGLAKAKSSPNADTKIDAYEKKNQSALRIIKTLALLKSSKLDDSASPAALDKLDATERAAAFSPEPEQRVATGIQFDAWTLTSIREPIAARPPVAPYLHGEAEWQPPETHVAWRQELDVLNTAELRAAYPPAGLLDDFPLKPHELLRDTSERIFDRIIGVLSERQKDNEPLPDAWLVRENGDVEIFPLSRLLSDQEAEDDDTEAENEEGEGANVSDAKKAEKARKNRVISRLADATLILPASLGGIDEKGLLTPDAVGDSKGKADVADIVAKDATDKRHRVWGNTRDVPAGFRLIRIIDKLIIKEDTDESDDSSVANRYWLWLETKNAARGEQRFTMDMQPETLAAHTGAVIANVTAIAKKLLPPDLSKLLVIAARLHDLGKDRASWQRNLGNLNYDPAKPETTLAKSALGMRPRNVAEHYRHEFGSLNDANKASEFAGLSDPERDIVLHIVAAHHGRARPHFPVDEIGDYANSTTSDAAIATETPRRFARVQKRFGRWGLAWLESLLRAADYAASAGIKPLKDGDSAPLCSSQFINSVQTAGVDISSADISLRLNPANPGHYFACCGLFELAAALAPDAHAWFAKDGSTFHIAATGISLKELLNKITASKISALDSGDRPLTPLEISLTGSDAKPRTLRIDWWRHEGGLVGKLKPWAGQMSVRDIADDMRETLKRELVHQASSSLENILFLSSTANEGEPFYFDANRAINAKAQDVGFSVDKLKKGGVKITSTATPSVELLCLIGLQRARPLLTVNERGKEREYDYHLWHSPLPLPPLAAAVAGLLPDSACRFRFSNPSRAKDYRAFAPGNRIS
ncbi:MAG TPA: type I-U CRISPR-associated helicase/endonuclease Cas3 [Lacunisphaera sp.]|jgi:CRISPR-associated endonuclease/helicase Cas3